MKKFTPRPYQHEIMSHALQLRRCNVFAEMGLGKSVSTLMTIDMAIRCGETRPTLIVAPKRVALMTWPMEVEKWEDFNYLEVQPIAGSPADRIAKAHNPNAPIFTINYEQIPWLVDHFGSAWPFGRVVADESTRLKSTRIATMTSSRGNEYDKSSGGSSRGRALAGVAFKHVDSFINLTGSPQPNGIQDLWGQCWFIDKGQRLGRSYAAFIDRWFMMVKKHAKSEYGELTPRPFAKDQIVEAIQDISIMLRAKDYLDLPPLIENVVYVELPSKARRHYNEVEKKFYTEIKGRTIDAVNAGSKTQKLKQIASGAAYASDQVEDEFDPRSSQWVEVHDEKLQALKSIVEEATGENILVAYHFKSDLARIKSAFPHAREMDDNPQTLRDWNAGLIPMLVAHPACLHPETEVLTEARGWVRIVDVDDDERVFDGIEFVNHGGCSYSGIADVLDVFGIRMTRNHQLLINDEWIEAENVGNTGNTRETARYTYSGDDEYLVKMLTLRSCGNDTFAKREETQQVEAGILFRMCKGKSSSLDRNRNLEFLERDAIQGARQIGQRLRGSWHQVCARVGRLQCVLRRHARRLLPRFDLGSNRRERGLLERELSMDNHEGTAIKQANNSSVDVSGGVVTPCRNMPQNWCKSIQSDDQVERRYECGGSDREHSIVKLRTREKCEERSKVYDIVDCGPRNRFVIRNGQGEVFVSHNSAGHGLNLQDGGRTIVYFSADWNLECHEQILERVGPTRQAQSNYNRPVFVHFIVARDTVDETVLERIQTKASMQELFKENLIEKRLAKLLSVC